MAFTPLKQFKTTLDTISNYVARLWFLAEVRWVLDDIRVTPTGTVTVAWSLTTITTVTTVANVTTVGNQTAVWWYQASMQVANNMNTDAMLTNYTNLIRS